MADERDMKVQVSTSCAEQALYALRLRIQWYESRVYAVPADLRLAFNALADALDMPTTGEYARVAP